MPQGGEGQAITLVFVIGIFSGFFALAPQLIASSAGPGTGNLHYADVVQAAAKLDEVILWEGLPSSVFEKELLAKELATKKTFYIGDEHFYSQPIALNDKEQITLSDAVLKHRENFTWWSGYKFCGGFHADYALEWRYKGATLAQALFCFSCDEAQFRVGNRVEQVDQSDQGVKRFRTLLLSHKQQRPPPQINFKRPAPAPFILPPPSIR